MKKILVAGIGTDVGKTIVSSLLAYALKADYWKPIQCGPDSDREKIRQLVPDCRIHPEAIALEAPRSPHHAAQLEGAVIDTTLIRLPITSRSLIIEACGGALVPLNMNMLTIDLFAQWNCDWLLVSRHYLGSINHTLLTIEAMRKRSLKVRGIIFNGNPDLETEKAILNFSRLPCLGRINQEPVWNSKTVHAYAKQWTTFPSAIEN